MTPPALVSINVFPMGLALLPGQTQQYTALGTYADNSQQDITALVVWTSSDPGVATITSAGLATAVAVGTTGITATSGAIFGVSVLGVELIEPAPPVGTWPVFDVVEMAQEAAEQAGIEFRSGYALRTARRSLELLSIEWANRGLNLWTIEGPEAIILEPGVAEYQLPPDTVDLIEQVVRTWWQNPPEPGTARWQRALEMARGTARGLRDWGDSQVPGYAFTDLPIERATLPEYAAIPNKYAQGRPTLLNMRRKIQPYFRLWMVPPTVPVYHLLIWRLRRMQSVGTGGTGQPEIPWRFVSAMIAGLAYYLALKSKEPGVAQRVPMLKAAYEEQFTLASDEDRDRAAFRFVPGGYTFIGGGW